MTRQRQTDATLGLYGCEIGGVSGRKQPAGRVVINPKDSVATRIAKVAASPPERLDLLAVAQHVLPEAHRIATREATRRHAVLRTDRLRACKLGPMEGGVEQEAGVLDHR